jgi:hypothetical protein
MLAPTKMMTQKPAKILRCIKMRGGTVAVLGRRIWIATNATSKTACSDRSALMTLLFQAWSTPPHCKASSKHTVPGINTAVPGKSSCFNFSLAPRSFPR